MKKSINRTNTLTRSLCLSAIAFTSATILAEDLTVSSDQTLALSTETTYDNLVLENGAKLTLTKSGSNAQTLKITGAISGTGTIVLDSARVGLYADVPDTVGWIITGEDAGSLENRIVGYVNGTPLNVKGSLAGSGRVRILNGTSSGSASGIKLSGDLSGFEGTLVAANGCYNKIGATTAGSKNMRLILDGNNQNILEMTTGGGTNKFGSVYTNIRATSIETNKAEHLYQQTYPWRFNTDEYILEVGHLDRDDDRITIKIGEANNNATGHVRIRKVGTGTLELWNPNHRRGIDIDNGTVLLTSDGALSVGNANITFGSVAAEDVPGGTLKYGVNEWDLNGNALNAPVAVTTDYSAQIKNSLAPISIDTGTNDVTYATALASSNVGGLVKKGEGTLTLSAKPAYTGKTVVEEGHLKTIVSSAPNSTGFEVKSGAEITFTSTESGFDDTGALGGVLADDATVNLDRTGNGLWRFKSYPAVREGFKGTVNFLNTSVTRADGLVWSQSVVGNSNAAWGVLGEPSTPNTRLFDMEAQDGATIHLGAFRLPSENGLVYLRYRSTIEIGNRSDVDSVINGKLAFNAVNNGITKIGSGRLVLGENFGIVAGADMVTGGTRPGNLSSATNYPALNITEGSFENNANLSAFTVNLSSGVTLSGSGTWPSGMAMPASYRVPGTIDGPACATGIDVDFSNGASLVLDLNGFESNEESRQSEHQLLVAKSINGLPDSSLLSSLNAGDTKGKWKFRKATNGDGTMTLAIGYAKNAFMIIVR